MHLIEWGKKSLYAIIKEVVLMENIFTKKMPLYFRTEEAQLIQGDSFKMLTKIKPESVDMIFADPLFSCRMPLRQGQSLPAGSPLDAVSALPRILSTVRLFLPFYSGRLSPVSGQAAFPAGSSSQK